MGGRCAPTRLVVTARSLSLWFSSNWQEEFELWWQLILSVQSVREVDSSDSTVGVDLHPQRLYVVRTVSSASEIRQVELNLVPALVQSHRHCAYEGFYSGGRLIIRGAETSPHRLVIQHLHLEGEVLLQVLDDHNQERKLDRQRLLRVQWCVDVVC
jgi:hypothetical protein